MAIKTEATFDNGHIYGSTNRCVRVEVGSIALVDGKRGYITKIGRKYVEVLIYGAKRVTVDPLALNVEWTGEIHY